MTPPRTEISSLKFLGYNLCLGPLGPSNNWLCRVRHPPTLLTVSIVRSLQSLTNHEKTINKLFHMEYFPVFLNPGLIFLSASSVSMLFHQCSVSSVFMQNKNTSIWQRSSELLLSLASSTYSKFKQWIWKYKVSDLFQIKQVYIMLLCNSLLEKKILPFW